MIPPHTYAAGRLAEEHRHDAWRESDHARLIRAARPARVGLMKRLLAAIDDLLISGVERMPSPDKSRQTQLRIKTNQ